MAYLDEVEERLAGPLTVDQMAVVRRWWTEAMAVAKRRQGGTG